MLVFLPSFFLNDYQLMAFTHALGVLLRLLAFTYFQSKLGVSNISRFHNSKNSGRTQTVHAQVLTASDRPTGCFGFGNFPGLILQTHGR